MNAQRTLNEVELLTDEELAAVSAGAIYMNFDDTKGEASTNDFKQWIELRSVHK